MTALELDPLVLFYFKIDGWDRLSFSRFRAAAVCAFTAAPGWTDKSF